MNARTTTYRNVSRHGGVRAAVGLGAMALLASACNDSPSEQSLEQLIEQGAGEDVDIDFGEDGSFSIQTEDGEFSIDIDDDGSFTFEGDESSATFDSDGDGDANIDIVSGDVGNDGTITITGEDGETAVVGDDGFTVTNENGRTTFESGTGVPDQWPSDVPAPQGLTDATGGFVSDGSSTNLSAAGTTAEPAAVYLAEYAAALAAAGFTETSTFASDAFGGGFTAERGTTVITVNVTPFGGMSRVFVGLQMDG